ncbi:MULTISPECIES: hypothetical protein [unclassified Microbacterium]|uniref:hypothetical protein n=1 Tax=unclassified Microbacterium TaxID=2609290 RepID=UPI00214C1C1B|nr:MULTISPECIES: hypothetical protein [unclassified Microbacterium]MCR2810579.1 hypothetical protein [Microbacterium sp. zg.B185]WIM18117.1 hypothetical protein QNO12_10925 [Microbacterium sp. zg-B185]
MSSNRRQRIERVPGARRAKLTPAPGTSAEPAEPADDTEPGLATSGPNDEQLRRDVPPHW